MSTPASDASSKPAPATAPPEMSSPGGSSPSLQRRLKRGASRIGWRVGSALLLGAASVLVWREVTGSARAQVSGLGHTPPPAVAVAKVVREDLSQDLVCDGEMRPYQEIDLHAKVAGYLDTIKVDIGDRVKAGELLATIEIPELEDDISAAQARLTSNQREVERASAAYDEAHLVFARLSAVDKAQPNLVAEQELDAARAKDLAAASDLAAAKAQVEVARAQLNKLRTMLKYSQINAPFAGVITQRFADPGALIQAGTSSSTQSLPVVRLSENDRLRLDVPVSVTYVSRVHVGNPVQIRVESLNTNLTGRIARTTGKIDTATRTMEVEIDVPNPDLRLIPGMYASVVLRLEHRVNVLTVPVEAVSRQNSCTVLVVNSGGRIEQRTVTLGLETPRKIEVLSGLKENELVMIGSRAQVKPGQSVQPKLMAANTAE